ncbi:hypothetical protein Tco_1230027 [Tanacetum coccineum]
MAVFLRLPNFHGCKVAAGSLLPPSSARVTHLAPPAEQSEDLPRKTGDMETAEIPCWKVLDDKEKKKVEAKAAANAPMLTFRLRRLLARGVLVGSVLLAKGERPLEALANKEHVSTNISAGRMNVLRTQTDEYVIPRPAVNVDELVLGEEKGQENVDVAFVNEGHGDNEDQRLESVKKSVLFRRTFLQSTLYPMIVQIWARSGFHRIEEFLGCLKDCQELYTTLSTLAGKLRWRGKSWVFDLNKSDLCPSFIEGLTAKGLGPSRG